MGSVFLHPLNGPPLRMAETLPGVHSPLQAPRRPWPWWQGRPAPLGSPAFLEPSCPISCVVIKPVAPASSCWPLPSPLCWFLTLSLCRNLLEIKPATSFRALVRSRLGGRAFSGRAGRASSCVRAGEGVGLEKEQSGNGRSTSRKWSGWPAERCPCLN